MSIFSWLSNKFKIRRYGKFVAVSGDLKNTKLLNAIYQQSDIALAIEQQQNYLWYKGDADLLMWFYTKGIMQEGSQQIAMDGFRRNYLDYYWRLSALEKGIKRTHSGLPKVIIDTLVKCLGKPNIDTDNIARTKTLNGILKANNFNITNDKQLKMDAVIGDGSYIFTIRKSVSDYPIIEYVDGRDCSFEYVGDTITAVIVCKRYEVNGCVYECYERRSTIKQADENGELKRMATIEYHLFERDTKKGYKEVGLDYLEQTKGLRNVVYKNIDVMLAVPCMREMDVESKRGVSLFKGKIELFDDFDQNISQESSIMKAITPVEYIDSNLLDRDKEGNPVMPSAFGKQFVVYKGSENYNEAPNQINSVFHDVDFNRLNAESLETLNRCLTGLISPSSLGLEMARNSSDLSQREKEKITLQNVKILKEYETEILSKVGKLSLYCYDLMIDENAEFKDDVVNIKYRDYANPTLDAKIQAFKDAMLSGAMSVERYVSELYGDESKEIQKQEKEYINKKLNENKEPSFNLGEF